MSLRRVPVTWEVAERFNQAHHRTHPRPPARHKFSIGCADRQDILRGIAMVGRPSSRHGDDGLTLEVTRCATDGTKNAGSLLYGAAAQAAQALGYARIITYNQDGESGSSLRAAGYVAEVELPARGGWDTLSRHREDHGSAGVARIRWRRTLAAVARPWTDVARPADPARASHLPETLFGTEEAS